jgi:phosphoglucosamine mutase
VGRQYFGTDGVRGVVGEALTPDLVERLGRAATVWSGARRVFVGRDTRGSGPELERALAEGIASAGATAVLGGVLPTPAVALAPLDLGIVVSASHNPPEYNGVKFFDSRGDKLSDAAEEAIEDLLAAAPAGARGEIVESAEAQAVYVAHVVDHFGADLTGLRVAVDCANGAYSGLAPAVLEQLGAVVEAIGNAPDGTNINLDCGATSMGELQRHVRAGDFDLGVAFDGDGDRMLAVDERGQLVDGDGIVAVLALHLGVDLVAVTEMTNMGFHALMRERGIRVITTDVGDRHVLEALRRVGGTLGGEQSGHIIYLDHHVTGDGLVAALLLCASLRGRPLSRLAELPRYFQSRADVPVRAGALTPAIREAVGRWNGMLGQGGRVLVRPSGTEPLIRVLVEAQTEPMAVEACANLAGLVKRELG